MHFSLIFRDKKSAQLGQTHIELWWKEAEKIEAKTNIYVAANQRKKKRGSKCDAEAELFGGHHSGPHHLVQLQQQQGGGSALNQMFRLLLMVALYYPLSVGLTFYQKWFIKNYRLPLLIVAGHYASKYLMAIAIRKVVEWVQKNRRVRVPLQEQLRWLMPIGFCASLDIGLSNWSLEYVTVSLYTMAKSSSILFIVGFSLLLKLERWRTSLGVSAFLIAFGLFLFTWQSTQLDLRGLLLVELAALCTGVRWTISQLIMQGEECATPVRHPLDMMIAVQVDVPRHRAHRCGGGGPGDELPCAHLVPQRIPTSTRAAAGFDWGRIGVSHGICGEGISLLLAHHLHGDHLSNVNILGLALCVFGMVLHSVNKHRHSQRPSASLCSPNNSRRDSSRICASPPSALVGRRNGKNMVELEDRRKLLVPEQITI